MGLDARIKQGAEQAAERLKLPTQFLAAWWVAENGWTWPATNNVGNISYTPLEGTPAGYVPSGGVFEGATRVEDNRVVCYGTEDEGVNAFVLLLETPKADKELNIDMSDLDPCADDVAKLATVVGNSNWAGSHYAEPGKAAGSLILDVYHFPDMVQAFAGAPQSGAESLPSVSPTKTAYTVYHVQDGDTLSRIALRFHSTVRALAAMNHIANPNIIDVGQILQIPSMYQVRPGDTVSAIAARYGSTVADVARANGINPNVIYPGNVLYV